MLLLLLSVLLVLVAPSCGQNPLLIGSTEGLRNYTRVSDFRVVNRRVLGTCPDPNPYLDITVSPDSRLPDEGQVTVTVSGVLIPAGSDWVAMITPANAEISDCPLNKALYVETGDISNLPLLCHYPVKAQWMSSDPGYLNCDKKECKESVGGICLVHTCSGSLTFHVVNIRTPIEFVFFTAGFDTPCMLRRSGPIEFANPAMPLYGHLSSIDSTGSSVNASERLAIGEIWRSGFRRFSVQIRPEGPGLAPPVSAVSLHSLPPTLPPSTAWRACSGNRCNRHSLELGYGVREGLEIPGSEMAVLLESLELSTACFGGNGVVYSLLERLGHGSEAARLMRVVLALLGALGLAPAVLEMEGRGLACWMMAALSMMSRSVWFSILSLICGWSKCMLSFALLALNQMRRIRVHCWVCISIYLLLSIWMRVVHSAGRCTAVVACRMRYAAIPKVDLGLTARVGAHSLLRLTQTRMPWSLRMSARAATWVMKYQSPEAVELVCSHPRGYN